MIRTRRKMVSGGRVRGPGGPTDDKIPAMLSNGEYVLPADTVAKVGKEKLDRLRAATHTFVHKADGGPAEVTAYRRPRQGTNGPAAYKNGGKVMKLKMRKEQGEQAVPCANGGMMQRLKKCADGGGIMQYSTIPLVARAANAMRPSPPLETGGRTIPTMSVQPGPSLQAAQAPVQAQSYKSRIDQAEDEAVNGSPKKMRSGGLVKKTAMKRR